MVADNQRMMKVYDKLAKARRHAITLVEAKSDHEWTNEECDALAKLCGALDVPIPGDNDE